jgi:hypothetical protein
MEEDCGGNQGLNWPRRKRENTNRKKNEQRFLEYCVNKLLFRWNILNRYRNGLLCRVHKKKSGKYAIRGQRMSEHKECERKHKPHEIMKCTA